MKKYKCLDNKYTNSIYKTLLKAIAENKVYNVFIGDTDEYRLICKESFMPTITDMNVFLEYAVYPLAHNSDLNINQIVFDVLDETMNNYCQLLPLYQIVSFFYEQDLLSDTYEDLPSFFPVEKYKDDIIDKVKQKRSELENYKAHGFDNQIKSMYEMIIGMINNSRSI